MADELPKFGDEALDNEINSKINDIIKHLHSDILNIVKQESPHPAEPHKEPLKAPVASPGPSVSSSKPEPQATDPTHSGQSVGDIDHHDNQPNNNQPSFWNKLWGGAKKAWSSGKEWVKKNLLSQPTMPSSPMSKKLGYKLGGTWANFKNGWDKGVQYKGKTWESFCSKHISDIVFKEECQDYFKLFNENKRISLSDYAETSGPVNYYIEEILYAYLDGLDWSNTILENLNEPIGVSSVEPENNSPQQPNPLEEKIMATISKYRIQIANLLKDYASKIHNLNNPVAAPEVKTGNPARVAQVEKSKQKRKYKKSAKPEETLPEASILAMIIFSEGVSGTP